MMSGSEYGWDIRSKRMREVGGRCISTLWVGRPRREDEEWIRSDGIRETCGTEKKETGKRSKDEKDVITCGLIYIYILISALAPHIYDL